MSNTLGRLFRVTLFGESHGLQVGCVIDGLPPGMLLDKCLIEQRLGQRKPSSTTLTTSRHESDHYSIVSGLFNDKTTGTPLCVSFENTKMRSEDYSESQQIFRPGHADYSGFKKFDGFNDYRGGGHFSARLTAPLVLAGAVAEQLLAEKDIHINVLIQKIGNETGHDIMDLSENELKEIQTKQYAIQDAVEHRFLDVVREAKMNQDSIGGVVSVCVNGVDAGIGEPYFDSVESQISKAIFSIPGVKGVEFGTGFEFASLFGSEANDAFFADASGEIKTKTNHNGGINGGITNGMPIVFRCVFKPTSSIGRPQTTLNFKTLEMGEYAITGRHDPCIALRAPAVVRAMTALVLYDLILINRGIYGKD